MKEALRIVRTALILLLISGITVLLIASVNMLTKAPIEERRLAELRESMSGLFPDADFTELNTEDGSVIYEMTKGNNTVGYCVVTESMGFGGSIKLLCGFDTELSVVGVKVTEHAETKSKFDPVNSKEHLSQYEGKTAPFAFGEGVDAVSGSTVSSKAILKGINDAGDILESYLSEKGEGK